MPASALTDTPKRIAWDVEEHGGVGSQYLGGMVSGGLDGIITTSAVVSGVAGEQLGMSVRLTLGLANLWAGSRSLGWAPQD
mgnify:CR=1 FL=1